jgi:hypothetical protein
MMGRVRKTDFELPSRVYRKRGKLYHVTKEGKWIQVSADKAVAADQAKHLHLVRKTPDGKGFADLRKCFERTRKNARHRTIVFELTWDDLGGMWHRSKGACEVSGIPFAFVRDDRYRNRAFAPSVDRLSNDVGYTTANCRLVCVAVNVAMNEWGSDMVLLIADGIRKTNRRRILLDTSNKPALIANQAMTQVIDLMVPRAGIEPAT